MIQTTIISISQHHHREQEAIISNRIILQLPTTKVFHRIHHLVLHEQQRIMHYQLREPFDSIQIKDNKSNNKCQEMFNQQNYAEVQGIVNQ